jgi:hypothetical protein
MLKLRRKHIMGDYQVQPAAKAFGGPVRGLG